jgi:hypothetical protein
VQHEDAVASEERVELSNAIEVDESRQTPGLGWETAYRTSSSSQLG